MGIDGDKIIHLADYVSEKEYLADLRMAEFYNAESEEVITFLTKNNISKLLDFPAPLTQTQNVNELESIYR